MSATNIQQQHMKEYKSRCSGIGSNHAWWGLLTIMCIGLITIVVVIAR